MKLTEEQKDKVLKFFKSSCAGAKNYCPACRAEQYLIVDEVVRCFPSYEFNEKDYTTQPTPVVLLTCNNCGFVFPISLPEGL